MLIDYENVQPSALSRLDAEHFKVLVFVGSSQAKVTYETAAALQRMGSNAEYIKISGNGSNALDFHIISKDTGFDPLIQHLKAKKIFADRSCDVSEIPLIKASSAKTTTDKITVTVENLIKKGESKPRTVKTLLNTISTLFLKQLSDEELSTIFMELQSNGYITVVDTKVSYSLPTSKV